jgi:transcription termination/antitermination protein NusG
MGGTLMAEACKSANNFETNYSEIFSMASKSWFALTIRQKLRLQCEAHLRAQQFNLFSPTMTEVRIWSDRKVRAEVPLFPGYLFCSFNPADAWRIIRTPGVLEIVNAAGRLLEVDRDQLIAVGKSLTAGQRIEVVPALFKGQRVRIISGPMAGIEGVLAIVQQELRVSLEITMMNRSVLVEIDRSNIEPIETKVQ